MTVVDLIDILEDDELNVKSEEVVFRSIQKWVTHDEENRKMYIPELLKCMRLGMVSLSYIDTMMSWKPIKENQVRYTITY